MRKFLTTLTALSLTLVLVGGGCTVENARVAVGLSAGDSMLARQEADGTYTKAEDNTFFRGEEVHTVVDGVVGFEKDPNGVSWVDIDIEIKDNSSGEIIFEQQGLLGENGKITLEEDEAAEPKAVFRTGEDMEPGSYNFKMKVYDKYGDGRVTFTNTFELFVE